MEISSAGPKLTSLETRNQQKAEIRAQMEHLFVKEMVKYAMPDVDNGYFGGGIGEDQFRSFLQDEWADRIAGSMAGKILRD